LKAGRSSVDENRWDEKAGPQRDALSSQVIDALEARETRRPAMKKLTTTMMQETLNKQDRHLTVVLDLGDRSSFYCVLNEAGEVLLKQKVSMPRWSTAGAVSPLEKHIRLVRMRSIP
jgi:hypothetical protein